MKKALLACCLFIPPFLQAQVTITQADMPNAGDTLRVSNSNDIIDPAYTDSTCMADAFVWNYASLTPASQWVRKFDSPTTFTFPFNLIFNPLNTSYGEEQYTPDSIPLLGIKPDDAYNFFKESSTKFKQIGTGLTINSLPLPMKYYQSDTIYRFPLKCGNRDSSVAKDTLSIPGLGLYGQTIKRWNFADGQGTLITPYGVFQSVRERSMISIRDTFSDTSGTVTFAFDRPLQYEYKWLVNGGKIPYLQVNTNNFGVVTQITYRDSFRTGVIGIGINESQIVNFNFNIYPNPAGEYAFVSYSLDKTENVKIELCDIMGRKICCVLNRNQNSGEYLEVINLAEKKIQAGIYFIKMEAGKKTGYGKMVVR